MTAGGRLFVTGYDSIASPEDLNLINFLGGTSSSDNSGARNPNAVTGVNSLSTGLIDIQGVFPTGAFNDWDVINGLGADTICVAAGTITTTCQWSIRSLGAGEIAYVSAGAINTDIEQAWTNTSAGGAGAYNAALRNFAFNSTNHNVPLPSSLLLMGLGLVGFAYRKKLNS